MKNSVIITNRSSFVKKSSPLLKSVQLNKSSNTGSPISIKPEQQDYFIQISPRLETTQLTFVNQIKKLKITDSETQEEAKPTKSQSLPAKEKIKKIISQIKNAQPKSQFYTQISSTRRLKTEF